MKGCSVSKNNFLFYKWAREILFLFLFLCDVNNQQYVNFLRSHLLHEALTHKTLLHLIITLFFYMITILIECPNVINIINISYNYVYFGRLWMVWIFFSYDLLNKHIKLFQICKVNDTSNKGSEVKYNAFIT